MRLIFLFLSLFNFKAFATCKPVEVVKIAVIDTGFGYNNLGNSVKLCKFGHKDFTKVKSFSANFGTVDPVPVDTIGHGTHVIGLVDEFAKKAEMEYCIVVIKYFSKHQDSSESFIENTVKAIRYANNIGVHIINYSSSGPESSKKEKNQISRFLNNGGIFVTAAGNDYENTDDVNVYPQDYDSRIISVGNGKDQLNKASSSNYGIKVNRWEDGQDLIVFGMKDSGTSLSAAVASGKILKEKTFCEK